MKFLSLHKAKKVGGAVKKTIGKGVLCVNETNIITSGCHFQNDTLAFISLAYSIYKAKFWKNCFNWLKAQLVEKHNTFTQNMKYITTEKNEKKSTITKRG